MNSIKILQYGGIVLTVLGAAASGLASVLNESQIENKVAEETVKKVMETLASQAKETL